MLQEASSEKARQLEAAGAAQAEVQSLADDLAAAKADLAGQLESAIAARQACAPCALHGWKPACLSAETYRPALHIIYSIARATAPSENLSCEHKQID